MDALDRFFADNSALPWAWGRVDCAMVLADWAVANGHADPFADYRGAYASDDEWRAIVTPRGGMAAMVAERLTGLAMASVPARGVLGVVGSPTAPLRQWGAIHDGARWRVRGVEGFGNLTARALGMWSV